MMIPRYRDHASTRLSLSCCAWLKCLLLNGAKVLFLVLLLLATTTTTTQAKKVSGNFKLSGEKSEIVLTSFAVVPSGGLLSVNFTTGSTMYEEDQNVRVRLYRDVEWPKFQKALTCADKVLFARQSRPVPFDYKSGQWRTKPIEMVIRNTDENEKVKYRPHYWYVVIDDCSLEVGYQRDGRIPVTHYELQIVNLVPNNSRGAKTTKDAAAAAEGNVKETHLSADEFGLTKVHMLTMMLSAAVAVYLALTVLYNMTRKSTIHAAVLWILVAAALDIGSSFLEIVHLQIYDANGIGSYFMDALAAHCEALCDAALVLFLLLIGAGWTLPSDVVTVNTNESVVQKVITDMAQPKKSTAVITCLIVAFHVVLAQWGRTYNDDFESYHDFEHLPGRILMCFRIVCALFLIVATVQTRTKCTVRHLQSFYGTVAVLGAGWLVSLPLLSWLCSLFVPYYLRHPAVFSGAAILQSSSLLMFAWLVTSHSTTYHQFSHMASSSKSKMSLTEALHTTTSPGGTAGGSSKIEVAEPRTWKFGKAKIRLD
ncbi:hypothetical protein ACA910_015864 [Epithemia clementina (nom. ined.)]